MCGNRSRSWLVFFWLVFCLALFSAAAAPIYPQNSPTQNEDIKRLFELLSEQRTAFNELERLSVQQSADLTILTNRLAELRQQLRELSEELERLKAELEISKEESASLRLQLLSAQASVQELQLDIERLKILLDESYQAERRALQRAGRAEANLRRSLIAGVVGWVLFVVSLVL